MEKMEHRLQAMICSSLEPIMCNVSNLEACVTAIEERVAPHEDDDEQEGNSPLTQDGGEIPWLNPTQQWAGSREPTHRKVGHPW